jgi:hypothetical protein
MASAKHQEVIVWNHPRTRRLTSSITLLVARYPNPLGLLHKLAVILMTGKTLL